MKHALELETAHLAFEALRVGVDVASGGFIALALSKLQQLGGVRNALGGALNLAGVGTQTSALAP